MAKEEFILYGAMFIFLTIFIFSVGRITGLVSTNDNLDNLSNDSVTTTCMENCAKLNCELMDTVCISEKQECENKCKEDTNSGELQ